MKIKTVVEMSYTELEELVKKTLPAGSKEYEFIAYEESSNDTSHSYDGIDGTFKYRNKDEDIKDIEAGKYQYMAGSILDYLCMKRAIPAGDYLIQVSW